MLLLAALVWFLGALLDWVAIVIAVAIQLVIWTAHGIATLVSQARAEHAAWDRARSEL